MAATAEALLHDERRARPGLRVVPDRGGRPDRRVLARRRLALLAFVAVTAFVAGLVATSVFGSDGRGHAEGGPAPAASSGTIVVVAPGDTVWDIAGEHLPEGQPVGDYVREILEGNDLDPTALQPGAVVRLPPP